MFLCHTGKESQRPVAHECLGEVLRILRQVINTYPLLNTVEILTAAGKLISKVKGQSFLERTFSDFRSHRKPKRQQILELQYVLSSGFHYEACNETDKKDFEKAIETIAVAFSGT